MMTMRKALRILEEKSREYAAASTHDSLNSELAKKLLESDLLRFELLNEKKLLGKHFVSNKRLASI